MSAISENFAGLPPLQRAYLALEEMQSKLEVLEQARSEPIAIIGMGCRFPGGADGPERFWRLLRDGVDAVSEVPPDRWDVDAFYDPDPAKPGKTYSRWGSFVNQVDQFDPYFFGISPREAASDGPAAAAAARGRLGGAGECRPASRSFGRQPNRRVCGHLSDDYSGFASEQRRIDALLGHRQRHSIAPAGCPTCSTFTGRASRSTRPARRRWWRCTWPARACGGRVRPGAGRRRQSHPDTAGDDPLLSELRALAPDGRCKTFDAARMATCAARAAASWCSSAWRTPRAMATRSGPWCAARRSTRMGAPPG